MRGFIILIIVPIFCVVSAHAISCYECDSLDNAKCGLCFFAEDVKQTDCDDVEVPENMQRPPATGCITQFYEGIKDQPFFMRRMCYYGALEASYDFCSNLPPDPLVPYLDRLECVVCDDDLCNAAPIQTPHLNSLTLLTIASTLLLICRSTE